MTRLIASLALAAACVSAQAQSSLYRGEFVHGKQVSLFTPCEGEEAFWVLEDGDTAARLVRAHVEMTTSSYEGVWAELRAERVPNDAVYGVPAEYDALLSLDAVYEVRPMPEQGCR